MEKKKKRLGEIIIIAVVLVCASLILINMSDLVSAEINGLKKDVAVEKTMTPTQFIRPTVDPEYTPEPIIDA